MERRVKNKEGLIKWFENNGYEKYREDYFHHDLDFYFNGEMFDFCGQIITGAC
jgi:hypothetical protein